MSIVDAISRMLSSIPLHSLLSLFWHLAPFIWANISVASYVNPSLDEAPNFVNSQFFCTKGNDCADASDSKFLFLRMGQRANERAGGHGKLIREFCLSRSVQNSQIIATSSATVSFRIAAVWYTSTMSSVHLDGLCCSHAISIEVWCMTWLGVFLQVGFTKLDQPIIYSCFAMAKDRDIMGNREHMLTTFEQVLCHNPSLLLKFSLSVSWSSVLSASSRPNSQWHHLTSTSLWDTECLTVVVALGGLDSNFAEDIHCNQSWKPLSEILSFQNFRVNKRFRWLVCRPSEQCLHMLSNGSGLLTTMALDWSKTFQNPVTWPPVSWVLNQAKQTVHQKPIAVLLALLNCVLFCHIQWPVSCLRQRHTWEAAIAFLSSHSMIDLRQDSISDTKLTSSDNCRASSDYCKTGC